MDLMRTRIVSPTAMRVTARRLTRATAVNESWLKKIIHQRPIAIVSAVDPPVLPSVLRAARIGSGIRCGLLEPPIRRRVNTIAHRYRTLVAFSNLRSIYFGRPCLVRHNEDR